MSHNVVEQNLERVLRNFYYYLTYRYFPRDLTREKRLEVWTSDEVQVVIKRKREKIRLTFLPDQWEVYQEVFDEYYVKFREGLLN